MGAKISDRNLGASSALVIRPAKRSERCPSFRSILLLPGELREGRPTGRHCVDERLPFSGHFESPNILNAVFQIGASNSFSPRLNPSCQQQVLSRLDNRAQSGAKTGRIGRLESAGSAFESSESRLQKQLDGARSAVRCLMAHCVLSLPIYLE